MNFITSLSLRATTASLLCFANILGMKGDIISCPHKDIYFLETNTKSESTDLANLFGSPAGKNTVKCKPRSKLKHKTNPALDLFPETKDTKCPESRITIEEEKCPKAASTSSNATTSTSRRSSLDLYEEAATILGLTCSQTDDCKCIECQCHYFDFEEDLEWPLGGSRMEQHSMSSCAIQ